MEDLGIFFRDLKNCGLDFPEILHVTQAWDYKNFLLLAFCREIFLQRDITIFWAKNGQFLTFFIFSAHISICVEFSTVIVVQRNVCHITHSCSVLVPLNSEWGFVRVESLTKLKAINIFLRTIGTWVKWAFFPEISKSILAICLKFCMWPRHGILWTF